MHHEWTAPISYTAIYAHPIEHVMSNLMPVTAGFLITGCHVTTAWLWIALVLARGRIHRFLT
jgi:sterol desaturase/sphingolipid hydroxylase (fatty acid hydroxylase superfamily)